MQEQKEEQEYKKLTVSFPANEYVYLKMACAKQRISLKDFVTRAVIRSVEDYEDELDSASLQAARDDANEKGTMSWEEMEKRLGWDKL